MFGLQVADGTLNHALFQGHYGIAAGLLIAGVGQSIKRQRILIRSDDGFLHQATDYTGFAGG
jgi:hypothetical protein